MRARDMVKQWVDNWLRTAVPGAQLPVDRELARRIGCSVMTVRRVLGEYARRGELCRIHGRGTLKPATRPSVSENLSSCQTSVEMLVNHLIRSIARGELRIGSALPPQKSIRYAFGLSPATVLAAYRRLSTLGLATQVGRVFRVGAFLPVVHNPPHDHVWIFYHQQERLEHLFSNSPAALAMQNMEKELMTFGRILCYAPMNQLEEHAAEWRRGYKPPGGIVLTGWEDPSLTLDYLTTALHHLEPLVGPPTSGKIAALVITTNIIIERPGVSYLSLSHANTVTRRVLSRCVWTGPYEGALFLINESRVGIGRYLIDAFRMLPEIRHLNPRLHFRYAIVPGKGPCSRSSFFERIYRELGRQHIETRLQKYGHLTLEDIEKCTHLYRSVTDACAVPPHGELWIVNDDQTGIEALTWCKQHGVEVPDRVAIVSLENNPHFRHWGLAACVHDWERTGYLMAHALIGDIPLEKTGRGFISTSALLLPRLTLRKIGLESV